MLTVINRTPGDGQQSRPRAATGWRFGRFLKSATAAALLFSILMVSTAAASGVRHRTSPAPGTWVKLGSAHVGPATLWRAPDNRDWVVWAVSGTILDAAMLAADGGISKAPATALHWSSLINDPTLISNGTQPLLVFAGQGHGKYAVGSIFGAVPGAPWIPQSWSLANNTDSTNGYGGAAVNAKGVISAAWAAVGGGMYYRIGVSHSIPASTPDSSFLIGAGAESYATEAVDANGNGHFYVAFDRFFSKPASADGIWVKDLTANGPPTKAPDSGTTTANALLQNVAFAKSTGKHGGVFAAYCSNDSTCSHVLLWRVGTKHPVEVPDSSGARFVAIASGPAGRLWLSWWDESTDVLYTVRTNKADTRFGPVESYNVSKQFFTVNSLGIGGGNFGRLDVVISGTNQKLASVVMATQSLTGLALSPGTTTISNKKPRSVVFTVTDAGDAVAGAIVKVDGHSAKTDSTGRARITFAKGTHPNRYGVSVTASNYFSASGKVVVTS